MVTINGSPTRAQEPAPPPEFSALADRVSVDVTVLGRDGGPVTGLGRESFTVLEDGQPQTIVNFEEFDGEPGRAGVAAGQTGAVPAGAESASAPSPAAAAHFVIVFVEERLSTRTARTARRAIERFLERVVRPGEQVTLFATDHDRWASGVWPAAKETLLAEVREVRGALGAGVDPENRNPAGIDADHPDGFLTDPSGKPVAYDPLTTRAQKITPQQAIRRETYYRQTIDSRRLLDQIHRLVDAQPTERARMALVLVSEPFFDEPGLAPMRAFLESCRRAHVAVYPLDPRGLMPRTERTDASTHNPGDLKTVDAPAPLDMEAVMSETLRAAVIGPETIAADTGGFTIHGDNDPGVGLQRVARETRSFYRLGYQPSSATPDGGFHRIEVRVASPGVTVRARRGYYAATGLAPADKGSVATAPSPPVDISTPSPPSIAGRYDALVRRYAGGHRDEAVRALAAWNSDETRGAAEAWRQERRAEEDRAGSAAERASVLLLTETGFDRGLAQQAASTTALLSDAREAVTGLESDSSSASFGRTWAVMVAEFHRSQSALDEAEAVLDWGEDRFGQGAELEREHALVSLDRALLAQGSAENLPYPRSAQGSGLGRIVDLGPAAPSGPGAAIVGDSTRGAGRRSPGFTSRERLEDAYRDRVGALQDQGRGWARDAAKILGRLARTAPDDEDLRLHLGDALQLGGRSGEAATELTWVAENARDEGRRYVALLLLGRIADEEGRLPEAIAHYRAAVAIRPSFQAGRAALSNALLRSGDRAGAEEAVIPLMGGPSWPPDDWLVYRFGAYPELRDTLDRLCRALGP